MLDHLPTCDQGRLVFFDPAKLPSSLRELQVTSIFCRLEYNSGPIWLLFHRLSLKSDSRVSHSGMPHSGVAHLSREMSLIRLDVQKASCLKDVFHLAGRVEKVCQKAGDMEAEKVQLSTQAIFQKNGMQSVLDLGMSCFQRLEEIENTGMTRDLSLLKELQQISSKARGQNDFLGQGRATDEFGHDMDVRVVDHFAPVGRHGRARNQRGAARQTPSLRPCGRRL